MSSPDKNPQRLPKRGLGQGDPHAASRLLPLV
jgi:hypothetical protein